MKNHINLKTNKKIQILLLVLIMILIFFTYILLEVTNEVVQDKKNEFEEVTIDDQISPLTNQGIIVQFDRFRHRGLLDEILKVGTSWKNPPKFYYLATIDGLEYSSKDVAAAGGASAEMFYETWDTMFQENRIQKDSDEEQETSTITIKIMQQESAGLLGFQTQDTVKEEIHLTYDYRTGRWSGDDNFKDDDGYGHYVGETYEFWFKVYQTDYDGDYIPYWTEVNVLGTDPRQDDSMLDPDGDGITTDWEWYWGYDPHSYDDHVNLDPDIDGIQNIEEFQMAKYFADPYIPDIYMETDGMERGGIIDGPHVFYEETGQIMMERFTEHGMNLYIDNGWPGGPLKGGGEKLPYCNKLNWDQGNILQFYKNHFAEDRKGIFRYSLICDDANPFAFSGNTEFNRYDTLVVGDKYLNLLPPRLKRVIFASIFLHELGHTLAIAPYTIEGCDNISFLTNFREYKQTWGEYRSVMNYLYILNPFIVDYSSEESGKYNQNDWETFYLPFFQIENNIVIEPGIVPPATEYVVNEKYNFTMEGWKRDFNITSSNYFLKIVENFSHDSKKFEWVAYHKKTADNNEKNIKIFAKPNIPISSWSLIYHTKV